MKKKSLLILFGVAACLSYMAISTQDAKVFGTSDDKARVQQLMDETGLSPERMLELAKLDTETALEEKLILSLISNAGLQSDIKQLKLADNLFSHLESKGIYIIPDAGQSIHETYEPLSRKPVTPLSGRINELVKGDKDHYSIAIASAYYSLFTGDRECRAIYDSAFSYTIANDDAKTQKRDMYSQRLVDGLLNYLLEHDFIANPDDFFA